MLLDIKSFKLYIYWKLRNKYLVISQDHWVDKVSILKNMQKFRNTTEDLIGYSKSSAFFQKSFTPKNDVKVLPYFFKNAMRSIFGLQVS